jgi:hypothetical protein
MPQIPEVQSSFSVQGPTGSGMAQRWLLHRNPSTQSALELHFSMQPVPASSQRRLSGQAENFNAEQLPSPSQTGCETDGVPPPQAAGPQAIPAVT